MTGQTPDETGAPEPLRASLGEITNALARLRPDGLEQEAKKLPGAVTNAMGFLRDGTNRNEASAALVAHFWVRVIGLARKKLDEQGVSRRHVGASDIALESITTLLAKLETGAYSEALDRQDLWKLLATITAHNASGARKHFHAVKRSKERGESALPAGASGKPIGIDEIAADASFLSESDSASFLLEVLETLSEEQKQLVRIVAEDGTLEAAKRLNCSQRLVQHDMKIIRAKIQRLKDEGMQGE